MPTSSEFTWCSSRPAGFTSACARPRPHVWRSAGDRHQLRRERTRQRRRLPRPRRSPSRATTARTPSARSRSPPCAPACRRCWGRPPDGLAYRPRRARDVSCWPARSSQVSRLPYCWLSPPARCIPSSAAARFPPVSTRRSPRCWSSGPRPPRDGSPVPSPPMRTGGSRHADHGGRHRTRRSGLPGRGVRLQQGRVRRPAGSRGDGRGPHDDDGEGCAALHGRAGARWSPPVVS